MGIELCIAEAMHRSLRIGCFLLAPILTLTGCGGSGGESDSGPPPVPGPGISITSPTSDPAFSQICNSEFLGGTAGFGTGTSCCAGTAEELTGVRVTWTNAATGASGQAVQSVQVCPIVILCNHTWSANIPLVLGDNPITVTASDTRTGGASSDTIAINKPILTYAISGTFLSDFMASPGTANSTLRVTRSDGTSSSSVLIVSSGSYGFSCVPDGTYTLTPSSTINYAFTPANRSVTVAGADVTGQNFTAPAFVISGSVTFMSNGFPVSGQRISLSGSGSTATDFTASDGSYGFLVPNGTYTLQPTDSQGAPQLTNPPNIMITVNDADETGLNFAR